MEEFLLKRFPSTLPGVAKELTTRLTKCNLLNGLNMKLCALGAIWLSGYCSCLVLNIGSWYFSNKLTTTSLYDYVTPSRNGVSIVNEVTTENESRQIYQVAMDTGLFLYQMEGDGDQIRKILFVAVGVQNVSLVIVNV